MSVESRRKLFNSFASWCEIIFSSSSEIIHKIIYGIRIFCLLIFADLASQLTHRFHLIVIQSADLKSYYSQCNQSVYMRIGLLNFIIMLMSSMKYEPLWTLNKKQTNLLCSVEFFKAEILLSMVKSERGNEFAVCFGEMENHHNTRERCVVRDIKFHKLITEIKSETRKNVFPFNPLHSVSLNIYKFFVSSEHKSLLY